MIPSVLLSLAPGGSDVEEDGLAIHRDAGACRRMHERQPRSDDTARFLTGDDTNPDEFRDCAWRYVVGSSARRFGTGGLGV